MNKILYILAFSTVLLLIFYFVISWQQKTKLVNDSIKNQALQEKPTESVTETGSIETPSPSFQTFENSDFKTVWIRVRDVDRIDLLTNFEEKLDSKSLVQKNNCLHLVSGGFFTEEGKPIGLFIADGETISNPIESTLFNGFFSISEDKVPAITSSPPTSAKLAVQSGPILMQNSKIKVLQLTSDELARRIVVATTKDNEVVFIAMYMRSNTILGPKLSEVPSLLSEINKNSTLFINDAINLDGGSHSAFLTDILKLAELNSVGSFFCVKP